MQHTLMLAVIICLLFAGTATADTDTSGTTRELNGTDIVYEYAGGRSYHVKFRADGISYRYLTGSKPEAWWGPFPYQAMRVENNLYFASWFEKGYGDYVTLLINFDNGILHGSAIIAGKEVHFQRARIVEINEP